MNVILSIKPEYANAIMNGIKKVEFRKNTFKKAVDKVFLYSSMPTKKIIGYFTIEKIIKDTPDKLWDEYNSIGYIEKKKFFDYYKNKKDGVAIKISTFTKFKNALDPYLLNKDFIPPQSYLYYDGDFINN